MSSPVVCVEEESGLYAGVFRFSSQAILITDADNRIVAVNPALEELSGFTREELIGRDPKLLDADNPVELYDQLWRSLLEEGRWRGELAARHRDGKARVHWTTVSVLRGDDEDIVNYIFTYTDISERKVSEERARHRAHHDALTGLYNRFSLEERLDHALTQASREGTQAALLFIDMDRFKQINDTLGHDMGDALLIEVARRLRASVRESDIVARIGGDEFVVVLTNLHESIMAAGVAAKVVEALGRPYRIGKHELHSSPSVGVSLFPDDGQEVEPLLKSADTAMYHAKERGRNNYQFFTAEMNAAAHERLALERDLDAALAKEQFRLYYQPQVAAADGRVVGVEALLHWDHPELGVIPPERFIPIAEGSGLIGPLGEWVLDQACRQLAQWKARGIHPRMAVNLSPRQLRDDAIIGQFRRIKAKYAIEDHELELEIAEGAVATGGDALLEKLVTLHAAGASLAIDDFGSACTSLISLKRMPVRAVKIDQRLVGRMERDKDAAAVCAAAVALTHSLGLEAVAEGVESEGQRSFFAERGCEVFQGYLFSPPRPVDEVEDHLTGVGDSS